MMEKHEYTEADRRNAVQSYLALQNNGVRPLNTVEAAKEVGIPWEWLQEWEEEFAVDTRTYGWEGTIDSENGAQGTLDDITDATNLYEGPCLVLPNGFRVYGAVDELFEVAMAVG